MRLVRAGFFSGRFGAARWVPQSGVRGLGVSSIVSAARIRQSPKTGEDEPMPRVILERSAEIPPVVDVPKETPPQGDDVQSVVEPQESWEESSSDESQEDFTWILRALLLSSLLLNIILLVGSDSDPEPVPKEKPPSGRRLTSPPPKCLSGLSWDQIYELFTIVPLGDLTKKNSKGLTPLMEAVLFGELKLFVLLVSRGASIEDIDDSGRSVFTLALVHHRDAICEWLIDECRGIVADQRDSKDWYAIHHIVKNGKLDLLLKFCNDPNQNASICTLKTKDDETPFMIAAAYGRLEMVKALQHFSVGKTRLEHNNALMLAAKYGHSAVIAYLLDVLNFSIDDYNLAGETPLMLAVKGGHVDAVRILIEHGANAKAVTSYFWWGRSAMSFAEKLPAGSIRDEIVALLEVCLAASPTP